MTTKSPLVLVVDDEPHMCNVVQRILTNNRYRVMTAPDGETAVRLTEENHPDVILLDLMMPGIDGREVCRRVRDFITKTQIIYFTAKAQPANPTELKELRGEADAFLTKPATTRQILSKVNGVLQGAYQPA